LILGGEGPALRLILGIAVEQRQMFAAHRSKLRCSD
jgi:hypothetical protein